MTATDGGVKITVKMLRLLTFGGLSLESQDGAPVPRVRPQRLAILAVLASAGDRGVSRERLAGLFWPDTGHEHARHSLRQALYSLRQELGTEVVDSATVLSLANGAMTSDVRDFRSALANGDGARAALLAAGTFLDGFYLSGAAAFERWVEEERAALTNEATRVTLALARRCDDTGDRENAVDWWRRLTTLDPLSGRFALGYLKALAASGDRAGALAFARTHENLVRRELEADADPEIRRLVADLRAMPSSPTERAPAPGLPPAGSFDPGSVKALPGPVVQPATMSLSGAGKGWKHRVVPAILSFGAVLLVALGANMLIRHASRTETPVLAVGRIREVGVPDSAATGGVLTDMLATNLARVAGLPVMANARLFALMVPGQDTLPAGYFEAAKRAGATEIIQGQVHAGPQSVFAMEVQRVDLATGLLKGAYRVSAANRYALVDSMTAAIARDLQLRATQGPVAEATTASPIAYRFYEEGLRAYYQYDWSATRRLMQAALVEDSTFAMAAYYASLVSTGGSAEERSYRQQALRLAARAPERERLTITAAVLLAFHDPDAAAAAESLSVRYPDDPRAFDLLAQTRSYRGNWRGAVEAIGRAVALDSASEPPGRRNCRLCDDLAFLAEVYLWWDSIPAAERTARRLAELRPQSHLPWHILTRTTAARGDIATMRSSMRRLNELSPTAMTAAYRARILALAEEYDSVALELRPLLDLPREPDASEARWFQSIALRNQGRIGETRTNAIAPVAHNPIAEALAAIEMGNPQRAVEIFRVSASADYSGSPRGVAARNTTWTKTLYGMALAALGDTARLRPLADTVELWGQRSTYERDRRVHYYLRGLLLVAEGRDDAAVDAFRRAMSSPTHGFTRINLELGRALLRLGRAGEAIPVLSPALRGDVDGSNLYVTRTELHEALGDAYAAVGKRDSAAVHYRAVKRAWERSDALFNRRRDRVNDWLARHAPAQAAAAPAGTGATGNGSPARRGPSRLTTP